MDNIYTIVLGDGTTIENVRKTETDQFYVAGALDADLFATENLFEVEIQLGKLKDILHNQACAYLYSDEDNTYFQFRDLNDLEKLQMEYEAKLDYLAAMTGVDFDE